MRDKLNIRLLITLTALALTACQSNPPAPVINRSPQVTKPAPTNVTKTTSIKTNSTDTRPDNYIVKKGDTLYSISLAFGYYYKDIAAANNISDPYPINIGQRLDFSSLNNQNAEIAQTSDGVTITPISTPPEPVSVVTPVLNEPKAVREPYSLAALNRKAPIKTAIANDNKTKTTVTLPPDEPVASQTPYQSKVKAVDNLNWIWPTQGKVTGKFNQASNKGIDIAGKLGQAINAAANGKVIYSGSDLRGYGKLVIVKHSKTYLSVYAHNNRILVKEGQVVKAGQKIAEMGKTDTNTVKLHYEIRKHGKSVDPAPYLPQN